jgi:hypothetical protein
MLKPTALSDFYRKLHARGESTATLAEKLGVSGGAVRRLTGGFRRRGPLWKRLTALLTDDERALLDYVERCTTWNAERASRRPRWTPEKQAAFGLAYQSRRAADAPAQSVLKPESLKT